MASSQSPCRWKSERLGAGGASEQPVHYTVSPSVSLCSPFGWESFDLPLSEIALRGYLHTYAAAKSLSATARSYLEDEKHKEGASLR
jgi:hypothetical protein